MSERLDGRPAASPFAPIAKLHGMRLMPDGQVFGVPDYEGQAAIERGLRNGRMPDLGNGFSFVIDNRPAGEKDTLIPDVEYAGYFSRGHAPITDGIYGPHDMRHVGVYKELFANTAFAKLTLGASANSLTDPSQLCPRFTAAMDGLVDNLGFLMERTVVHADVLAKEVLEPARVHLQDLIDLDTMGWPEQRTPEAVTEIFGLLWQELGFEHFEQQTESGQRAYILTGEFDTAPGTV